MRLYRIGSIWLDAVAKPVTWDRHRPLQSKRSQCAFGMLLLYRRLGGGAQRPNREIVSFRSCVRARGDCQVEMSLKRDPGAFPLPFAG